MKESRSWSHMSARTTDETCFKNIARASKTVLEKRKGKKIMTIAKLFALHANAIMCYVCFIDCQT